jgi:hypothetical protein
MITCWIKRNRDVMMTAEEYTQIKRREREVLPIEDFINAGIGAAQGSEPSADAEAFNFEVEQNE